MPTPTDMTGRASVGAREEHIEDEIAQAVFRCVHCGHEDHADINAAKEILRRSTSGLLVEGSHQRPVEARTIGVAA